MSDSREKLMEKIAAESGQTGDYTYEDKMAAVAAGMMDPKEVGLTSAEEAKLQIEPEAEKAVQFGDVVEFAAGVVPLALRAQWALGETKVVLAPSDQQEWTEKWITEHKHEYLIQGKMHCGSSLAQFERTYKDPILGLAAILRLCGDMLEKRYLGEELPPAKDPKKDEQTESEK